MSNQTSNSSASSTIDLLARIGLLAVGIVAPLIGISEIRLDPLSVFAAAACFAVSAAAFGILVCTSFRR